MGPWGHGMSKRYKLSELLHTADLLAPAEATASDPTPEDAAMLEEEMARYLRNKLDTDGLGDKLPKRSRDDGQHRSESGYQTVLLAAIMMQVGATIKPEHLLYLRKATRLIEFPTTQVQFLACLDLYQAGVPRNFQDDSPVYSLKDIM
ncbi:hypothetical protein N7463_002982 [Penicillium fimorum]|uniref:Uncharacterized protein n=1 Tax=Penicillium fimorum TaxID=1882269 RepID=A0A9W9Y0V8_9EURO|nr:hypothetical protein N7463_002982 [Penicillium fimorum]